MTQPLVSEPCDTPDRVTIFMNVTDRPYFGRFLTTIADADERRTTTRRYRRRRRSNGRSRTYPVTGSEAGSYAAMQPLPRSDPGDQAAHCANERPDQRIDPKTNRSPPQA